MAEQPESAAAALPRAQAAVLGRLWSALLREPLPAIATTAAGGSAATVRLADGRQLRAPAVAPFAAPQPGLQVSLDGRAYAEPAALVAALPLPRAARDRFAAELANSVANLAAGYAQAPPPPTLAELSAMPPDEAVVLGEQLVVAGHPLHPCCRTRCGMSPAEVRAYAPEHRPTVAVRWWAVPRERWWSEAGLPPLLPVHPWQEEHILDRHPDLRPTERISAVHPLMSLRTVALDATTHLKLAVDVQMTSAVRRVSAAALHNGPRLSAVLRQLRPRLGSFAALDEPAGGAVLVDGEPAGSLAVLRRTAGRPDPGGVLLPLAALSAPGPPGAPPLAVQAARAGFGGDPTALLDALLRVYLPPAVTLLHAGIALEAHGQNTLVDLVGGRPVRIRYRDFGGVRVSPARLAAAGVPVPPLRGDIVDDDPAVLRTTLAGSLGVVIGELVAVLCADGGAEPGACWAVVSAALADAFAAVPGAEADEAALRAGPVPVKATTAMRLAEDPLTVRWAAMPYGWEGPQ